MLYSDRRDVNACGLDAFAKQGSDKQSHACTNIKYGTRAAKIENLAGECLTIGEGV
jgi:hypothetical protein